MKEVALLFSIFVFLGACASVETKGVTSQSSLNNSVGSKIEAVNLAERAVVMNDLDGAIVHYIQALEFEGVNTEILFKIGELHNRAGNTDMALKAFTHSVQTNPDFVPALTQLGVIHLENKRTAKARLHLNNAIMQDQKRLKNENYSNGELVSLDVESPTQAYNVFGVISDLDGKHVKAKVLLMLALAIDNESPIILTNIGYSHYLSGNNYLAESYFKRALSFDSGFQRARLDLGLVYVRNGQYEKAFQTLKRVMTDAEAYNDIGYFLMIGKRYQEADYFFQNAINLSLVYFEKAYENLATNKAYLNKGLSLTETSSSYPLLRFMR